MCHSQIRAMTPMARFLAQSLPSLESDRQELRRAVSAARFPGRSTHRSTSAPAEPVSRKSAEITTAAGTLRSAHWPMTVGAAAAGVTTTARSMAAGMSATDRCAWTPSTLARFGLTG
jgi:hypothetical protein